MARFMLLTARLQEQFNETYQEFEQSIDPILALYSALDIVTGHY